MTVSEIAAEVELFFRESGVTKISVAKELGMTQPQITKIANKDFVHTTGNVKKVLSYIRTYKENIEESIPEDIQKEIREILKNNPRIKINLYQFISNINQIINQECVNENN